MKKFLPFALALAFTALALGVTFLVVRPGIRSIQVPRGGWRHKLADVIDEITEQEADR